MTSTDTLFANQARKAEATSSAVASLKASDTRSAEDDMRFTEELRAASREESRIQEERARERQSEAARAEDARNAQAREDNARAAQAREDQARAEDARARDERTEEKAGNASDDAAHDSTAESASAAEEGSDANADAGPKVDTGEAELAIEAATTADTEAEIAVDTTVKTEAVAVVAAKDQVVEASAKTGITAATGKTTDAGTDSGADTKKIAGTAGNQANGNAAADAAGTSGKAQGKAAAAQTQLAETASAGTPTATETAKASDAASTNTTANLAAATRGGASTPVEETVVAAKDVSLNGKRGLGHATAEAMSDTRGETKSSAPRETAKPDAQALAADKPAPAAATRSAASEIALQAALKPTGTPQDARLSSIDSFANPTPQAPDAGAPAPTVTVRAIMTANALPGTPVQPQTPAREIAVNMARNLANGSNTFEIRLDPAELGRIDVRMELSADGRVQAHLTVDKQETLDMLQRDARGLEKALSDAGLDMEGGSLGYSLRDDGDGKGPFAAGRETEDKQDKSPNAEDALTTDLASVQHVYALRAGSGLGVDIRI